MKSKKNPSKVIDIKKALAEKSAKEFSNEIKTGNLYKELKPTKPEKKNWPNELRRINV